MAVYDDQDTKTDKAAQLEAKELEAAVDTDGKSEAWNKELGALGSGDPDKLGKGFTGSEKAGSHKGLRGLARKKGFWAGIGIGGGVAGLLVGGFMGLLPLKLVSVMSTIQNTAFSNAEAATGGMGENLFRHYMVKQVIPGLDGVCRQTNINRSCARFANGDSPVAQLYNAWRDANLEGKMASVQGGNIEIEKRGNRYFMRAQGVPEIDLGPRGGTDPEIRVFNEKVYAQMSRNEIRQVVKAQLNDKTHGKSMLYKYRVYSVLKKKYGIHRTALSNWLADKTEAKRTAAKTAVIARVVSPLNEAFGIALSCSLSGFDCTGIDSTDADGRKMTKAEVELRAAYAKYAADAGPAKLDKLNKNIEGIRTSGVFGNLLTKLPGTVLPKIAGKFIPVYGWVDAGIVVGGAAVATGSSLQALSYMMNSSAMVQLFSLYSTAADEQKMGDVDIEAVGSFAESFDATDGVELSAPASSSLLYKATMEGNDPLAKTAGIFSGRASAATTPLCEGADSMPLAGEYVCEIEKLDANEARASYINTVGVADPVTSVIVDIWNNTAGLPLRWLEDVVGGFIAAGGQIVWDTLPQDIKTMMQESLTWLTDQMIPSPFMLLAGDANYGSRTFNMLYGGGVVAANDAAQYGLGGQVLSPTVSAANDAIIAEEKAYQLASRSLTERLFDKESPDSFVSKVALALPSNANSGLQQTTGILKNPLQTIGSAFSSLFSRPASANTNVVRGAAFGIPDYGYDLNDASIFSADPEQLWSDRGCANMAQTVTDWSDQMTLNPLTQQHESHDTNPCKLLEAAIGSYGGIFDEDLIPASDRDEAADGGPNSAAQFGPLDVAMLKQDTTHIACAAETKDLGTGYDGYINGQRIPVRLCGITNFPSSAWESNPSNSTYFIPGADGMTVVSSYVSANVYAMVQAMTNDLKDRGIVPSTSSHFRTMQAQQLAWDRYINGNGPLAARPGYSNHQSGVALDFQLPTGNSGATRAGDPVYDWLVQNAGTYYFDKLGSESWHWDPIGI